MTPRRSDQGPGGVPDSRPLGMHPRGTEGGLAAERTAGGGGPGSDHYRGPGPRCMSTVTGKNTGSWLTMQPSTVNGKELGAQEWRDALFL